MEIYQRYNNGDDENSENSKEEDENINIWKKRKTRLSQMYHGRNNIFPRLLNELNIVQVG